MGLAYLEPDIKCNYVSTLNNKDVCRLRLRREIATSLSLLAMTITSNTSFRRKPFTLLRTHRNLSSRARRSCAPAHFVGPQPRQAWTSIVTPSFVKLRTMQVGVTCYRRNLATAKGGMNPPFCPDSTGNLLYLRYLSKKSTMLP